MSLLANERSCPVIKLRLDRIGSSVLSPGAACWKLLQILPPFTTSSASSRCGHALAVDGPIYGVAREMALRLASEQLSGQYRNDRPNSGGYQLFALFKEPITTTGVPTPQARGLASLKLIVERSRKRTVNS